MNPASAKLKLRPSKVDHKFNRVRPSANGLEKGANWQENPGSGQKCLGLLKKGYHRTEFVFWLLGLSKIRDILTQRGSEAAIGRKS